MIALHHIAFVLSVAGQPVDDDPALAEATAAWEAERWPEAAEAFGRAYEHDPQPKYLYGRAQALRFAGDCETAIDVYEAFIVASDSEEADQYARDAIGLCEDSLAEREPKPPPRPVVVEPPPVLDPPRPRPQPPKHWARDALGHALFWPGVALVATGAALVPVAYARADTADGAPSERGYLDALDRASAMRIAGITTLAVGGALLLAGTIRFAVIARRGRSMQR